MFDIQKTRRLHELAGKHKSGGVGIIPDLLCVRKHMDESHVKYGEWKKFSRFDHAKMFGFVSAPQLIRQHNNVMKHVNVWCHPFRKQKKIMHRDGCHYQLLPESDFMDAEYVFRSEAKVKYDFFYMTVNAKAGIEHKGLNEFIDCLPVICGKMKLRGLIIVYYPAQGSNRLNVLTSERKRTLSHYDKFLTFNWGWLKQPALAAAMASCRFGFFPNQVDCSPRIIPECLVRDRPVLLNKKIWGGWHYVNEHTGSFINFDDSETWQPALEFMMSHRFSPMENFMSNFGFARSAARLAEYLGEHFEHVKEYSHVYFRPYKQIIERLC